MADSNHSQILGVFSGINPLSPCVVGPPSYPGTAINWQVVTWGPVVTIVSAGISSGAPAPGIDVFVCPGDSSTIFVVGTPSALGVFNFTIDALLSNASHLFITCEQTVTLAGPPAGPGGAGCSFITLSPATLDDVFQTEPISIQFEAEDGTAPYTWDLAEGSELPDGLTLSSGGLLAGAATTPGSYEFTIRALDDDGCRGIAIYALEVLEPDPIVVLPVPPLAGGAVGQFYEQQFAATGGIGEPYVFTITDGEIPTGTVFDAEGLLDGFPTIAGLYVFTVRATDGGSPVPNFGEREYSIAVAGILILIGDEPIGPGVISAADLELPLNRQATGRLEFGDGWIPARGVDVLIYARDGVTPIFDGLVISRRVEGMTDSNPANKGVAELVDYSIYFDDATVTLSYEAPQYLEDVIADIVDQALAIYGITYTPTSLGITVDAFTWEEISVTDAFKRITDATGVVFRERPIKRLDVFVPLDTPAPVTITDANVNAFDLEWSDGPNLPANTVDLLCGPTGTGIATKRWTVYNDTEWAVDIQAVLGNAEPAHRANAYLAVDVLNFSAGDTITLGGSTYTFRASLVGDVAGEVLIGATPDDSLGNLNAAINLAGGGNYAPSTAANADASSYLRSSDVLEAQALVVGAAGNSIGVASSHEAVAFWYGEGGIPRSTFQLGSDATGVAGWTQGYVLEDPDGAAVARTLSNLPAVDGYYTWDVTAGKGTIAIGAGVVPPNGTVLELKYLAVYPFHARVPAVVGPPPITFREDHPEIVDYDKGIELATAILAREEAGDRELEVFTDVDGFLPGMELEVDTTHRGGIVAFFLVSSVRIHMVNAELWEYRITNQQSEEYKGSFVEKWKALTSSNGSGAAAAPGELTQGGAIGAGDVYRDGRAPFTADQSMGGNNLTNVADPVSAQDAATLALVDTRAPAGGVIFADGSVDFTAPQSMGGNALTDLEDPTDAQDAATKAFVLANAGGTGSDRGFVGVGGGIHTVAAGPILVKPTGTTLTFVVGIGIIGTGDATVYANVQLTDLTLDDARAVVNNSLVSFGGQHLFGLVHITGLVADKEYLATLLYSARRNAAAIGGGPGAGQPFLLCLNMVTAIAAASLETSQASSSGTMADLATAGPSVTVTPPTNGVVAVLAGDSENRVQTGTSSLGIDVSSGNTLAAVAFANQSTTGAQNIALQGGLMLARLANASTVFKLQYASDGGSNTRYARWIAALSAVFGDTPITFGISQVFTAETTSSTSYVGLTTADAVTLTTGTEVLVLFSVNTRGSGALDTSVAVDVSGATTTAAADGVSNAKAITAATQTWHVGRGVKMTVNAGSNTFTLKYKVSGGTGTFLGRVLAVIRLN